MAGGKRENAGRKPKDEEKRIRDLVSPYIPGAIECVVKIMQEGEKDADRLAASKLLIEYWAGKPKHVVEADVTIPTLKSPLNWKNDPDASQA